MRLLPDPKLASNAGASWLNPVRSAGDTAITSAPGALDTVAPSASSRPAGTPCALSAAHMSGSQPMMSSLLTWAAIQAAACDRTDAATPANPADPTGRPWYGRADDDTRALREDVPVNRTTPAAVPPTTSAQITSNSTRRGRRRPRGRSSRRDA